VTAEPGEVHPTAGLGEVVHQRARLGILTVLGEADRVDFPYLQLTDGNLGRHIEVLASEGLVRVTKATRAGGPGPGWRSPSWAGAPCPPRWTP
jgi:hypothetical protein